MRRLQGIGKLWRCAKEIPLLPWPAAFVDGCAPRPSKQPASRYLEEGPRHAPRLAWQIDRFESSYVTELRVTTSTASQQDRPLRLVVMGTGGFAVPMLHAAVASRHDVLAVVTQPLKPARNQRNAPPPPPTREAATKLGLPILDPPSVNSPEAHELLRPLHADLFLVADYGQILSPETLSLAPLGGMNLHGSLLPQYRGAAPVAWAIYDGQKESGVSILHMTPKVDAGPVLGQARVTIDPDETAEQLEHRLAAIGGPLMMETVDRYLRGEVEPVPQDPALATKAPRLKKTDGLLNFARTAQGVKDQWRAMQPWPGCYTFWHRSGSEPLRLIVGKVALWPGGHDLGDEGIGTVIHATDEGIAIACGQGSVISLEQLQPAGKRMMTAAELLRGYPIRPGDRFGDAQ